MEEKVRQYIGGLVLQLMAKDAEIEKLRAEIESLMKVSKE